MVRHAEGPLGENLFGCVIISVLGEGGRAEERRKGESAVDLDTDCSPCVTCLANGNGNGRT